jgi:hypothetical protein
MMNKRIVDQAAGDVPTDIQGRTLILLAPDEVWESGMVMLKETKAMKFPKSGIRHSPIRVKIGERSGCIWKEQERKRFTGRIVRVLRESDARSTVELFTSQADEKEDKTGIRVQPGWLGI